MSADTLSPIAPHSRLRSKNHVPVEVLLNNGSLLIGYLFLGNGERVLDLLNDARPFLPFRQDDANLLIIAKTSIAHCRPLEPTAT